MNALSLIHLEHALPALSELGLEHVIPLFIGKSSLTLDSDSLSKIMESLSRAAGNRAIRRLVMVSRASADDLLEIETSKDKEHQALKAAACCTPDEAKEAILGFFSQLGVSLSASPDSLALPEMNTPLSPASPEKQDEAP